MPLLSLPLLGMMGLVVLRESCFGASSNSLKYFYTGTTNPSQGQPFFVAVGFVDDQLFSHYDSHSRKAKPRVSWMEKVGKDDPQYWDTQTQRARVSEEAFRVSLEILRNRYNQSEGLHTLQWMYGCELRGDGSKGGVMQHGCEGRTFITFDKETLTWEAPDPQAQITQRKLDALPEWNQRKKAYLEEICIEWLERHLSYGKEMLLRTETPEVTVSNRMAAGDGMEVHVCRVHGFYPREIDASWTRDGEVWLQDTFHRSVAPNEDGTFHLWLSIWIDPKERSRYRCHVEHDGLPEPLDVPLKEPTNSKPNLWLIIGCVVAALVLIARFWYLIKRTNSKPNLELIKRWFWKKRQDGYNATPTNDKGSRGSDQSLISGSVTGLSSSDQGRSSTCSSPPAVDAPSIKTEE